ncbi:hypothetical protein SAMN05421688_2442 [Poseidonocella pacifica]|uniref:DUF302 domain-containing protein n=1 Tax=Poseidonocella pacifica TaxID=871651 RepID=A0A1I0XSC8_9RHOB|nr:DUF302 domain-containing protein [Poseidonocella pacifica]SFB03965.1 hypothetical protein SAMN05421688_2442 [Poseidonocella pacifica]
MIRSTLAAILLATPLAAQDAITYTSSQSFEDVLFGLESAILDEGLVIDSRSKVGDMLERTREDVGSDVVLYEEAEVLSFCSARVSRQVMEADPMNIVFCPYDIFVASLPGADETIIGFRTYPDGPMMEVQNLLDSIAKAAIGQD